MTSKVSIGQVSVGYRLTNTTNMFLVVGNKNVILGHCEMQCEAECIAKIVGSGHCDYSTIDVVSPGETVSGDFFQPVLRDWNESDDQEVASEWAKMGIEI